MIPLGWLPRRGRRRAVGNPRAARRARVQRRSRCGPLVRRLGGRVPGLGDRRRAARRRSRHRCPTWFTTTMLALNITVGGTIVFTLLAAFAEQRRDAPRRRCASEQATSREPAAEHPAASDRRPAEAQDNRPIADGFGSRRRSCSPTSSASPPLVCPRACRPSWAETLNRIFSDFDRLAEANGPGEDRHDRRLLHGRRRAYRSRGPTTPTRWRRWRWTCREALRRRSTPGAADGGLAHPDRDQLRAGA